MKNYYLLTLLLCFCIPFQVFSVRAYPFPFDFTQPDGSVVTIRLFGDENFHYAKTIDGYTLLGDRDGFYKYAQLNESGNLICSEWNAKKESDRTLLEKKFLENRPKNLSYSDAQIENIQKSELCSTRSLSLMKLNETGELRSDGVSAKNQFLVILVNFTDIKFTNNPSVFINMLNQPGYSENNATGSARDFFYDNSFGKFTPQFDVIGPLNLSRESVNYGAPSGSNHDIRPREMVVEACRLADQAGVDFSAYDLDGDGVLNHVCVVFAGYNQAQGGGVNTIWPHEWVIDGYDANFKLDGVRISTYSCSSELRGASGNNHEQIGTFCHEFCHALGLPDLYDTGGNDSFDPGGYATMASGSYNNGSRTPPFLSAFERQLLGWHTSTKLTQPTSLNIEHALKSNVSYWYPTLSSTGEPNDKECFFIENRQQKGWDKHLPGHGLMIYHVDRNENVMNRWRSNQVNADPLHHCFDIEEADNIRSVQTLNADLFPAGALKKKLFSDLTQPSSRSWEGNSTSTPLKEIEESADGIITTVFIGKSTAGLSNLSASGVRWSVTGQTIQFDNLQDQTRLELYSVYGAKIYGNKVQGSTFSMNVPYKGVFILKMSFQGKSFAEKIFIGL